MRGNDSWLDDPEWEALRRQVNDEPASPVQKSSPQEISQRHTAPPDVTPPTPRKVNLSLDISLPKLKLPRFPRKKVVIVVSVVGVLIGAVFASKLLSLKRSSTDKPGVLAGVSQQPSFDTVIPDGKKVSDLKMAYDSTRNVASFQDQVENVTITVSQQPLPEAFKSETDKKVEQLAKDFSATDVIHESNPKAYLGTSVKGPQTVIFTKKDLLVFIFSPQTLEKDSWSVYITKLL